MNTYQNNKLELKNITKYYNDDLVVNNISFVLKENEFVSLLGPSGCGKSTIFNIVSGLIKPEKGKVYIDGIDYTGQTGRVSYMHQKDLLLPWRKVIDNISLPLIIKGSSKKQARNFVKPYFKIFGLEGFEYKYPFQLSGGMKQRAALLRTYMFSKDIMLLDEPFGGLDAITKFKMQDWLLNIINCLKTSVLFITHDIEEAIFLSDKIYILSDRPSTIKCEIIVDFPRPRKKELITTEKFNNLKKNILQILN